MILEQLNFIVERSTKKSELDIKFLVRTHHNRNFFHFFSLQISKCAGAKKKTHRDRRSAEFF
jgi:hypothetical protein